MHDRPTRSLRSLVLARSSRSSRVSSPSRGRRARESVVARGHSAALLLPPRSVQVRPLRLQATLGETQRHPVGSTPSPSLRSNRLQAAYRPPAHCLSASAMCCSLATLARTQAVVAVVAGPARPSGRAVAAAPRPSPYRGWSTSALPLAHIPAARSSRSSRLGRLALSRSRPRVRPVGRRPRFRSGESMFARVRGLPPLSVRTVR